MKILYVIARRPIGRRGNLKELLLENLTFGNIAHYFLFINPLFLTVPATGWLFQVCSRLRRGQLNCLMTLSCVGECRRV